MKYTNQSITTDKIDRYLISRRIHKIATYNSEVSFEDFYRIFLDRQKALLIQRSTPGKPSDWNQIKPQKLNQTVLFSQNASLTAHHGDSNTKSFKKSHLNKDEELFAFKKYFICDLHLQQEIENTKIKLISNE